MPYEYFGRQSPPDIQIILRRRKFMRRYLEHFQLETKRVMIDGAREARISLPKDSQILSAYMESTDTSDSIILNISVSVGNLENNERYLFFMVPIKSPNRFDIENYKFLFAVSDKDNLYDVFYKIIEWLMKRVLYLKYSALLK